MTPSQDASSARFNLVTLRVRVRAGIKAEQKTRQYIPEEKGYFNKPVYRRITAERTTFRHLISDARRELARSYLSQPALELGEVACLLGYEDPNSFFRAFREWEGTTPSEWRRSAAGRKRVKDDS